LICEADKGKDEYDMRGCVIAAFSRKMKDNRP
jgi:hypothetical protein